MTITIEIPDELSARLAAVGIPADEAREFATAALSEVADNAEVRAWWGSLTQKQRESERARTRASLDAADSGNFRPAEEVFARVRAKQTAGGT